MNQHRKRLFSQSVESNVLYAESQPSKWLRTAETETIPFSLPPPAEIEMADAPELPMKRKREPDAIILTGRKTKRRRVPMDAIALRKWLPLLTKEDPALFNELNDRFANHTYYAARNAELGRMHLQRLHEKSHSSLY